MKSYGYCIFQFRKTLDCGHHAKWNHNINSDVHVATLKKLETQVCRVRPHRQKQDVLLLHDNVRQHVSHKTAGVIIKS